MAITAPNVTPFTPTPLEKAARVVTATITTHSDHPSRHEWSSADLAVDELYDGPFGVRSAVDSPRQRRLLYEILVHPPDCGDLRRFLARLGQHIESRGGVVRAVTTDGSRRGSRSSRADARKRRRRSPGRWPGEADRNAGSGTVREPPLFVRNHLSVSGRETLKRRRRGERTWKSLRAVGDEVYRLFDRRCRTETGLAKLDRPRCRVKRFKSLGRSLDKLKSPTLEKAREFWDDKLMPATSNAVERGNRRHRNMQKSGYRVCPKANLAGRMALDLQRERHASGRESTRTGLPGDHAPLK